MLIAFLILTIGYLLRRKGPVRAAAPARKPSPLAEPAMTRPEALAALGLEEGATPQEVKAAYRRLMLKVHPDQGGSEYLATKLNQAKDLLSRSK